MGKAGDGVRLRLQTVAQSTQQQQQQQQHM
jgi:hypothetical protein